MKVIGIDLGTTNSCVAVVEGNVPTVITNSEGNRTTPSIVGFTDSEKKVGDSAKRQAITNPKRTVHSIKRFMGESYSDVTNEIEKVSYDVVKSDNNMPKVSIDGKLYTPQEISALIQKKKKKTAEDYCGETITDAVITVPAYFNDSQRQATKEAGEIAGLNVRRIINEPTAAALAYGLDKNATDRKIAVYDFGGGTFDISILELGDGIFEVLSTDGDTHLGGDDVDYTLIDWMVDEFKKQSGIDLSKDSMAMQRLKEAAEKAKIELSSSLSTEINLPYITVTENGPQHFTSTLTRAKFESLIEGIINRTLIPCESAIKKANINKEEIDEIILVGGSTRIPAIQKAVENFFGKVPNHSVNPDEAVACGAAIQGAILNGEKGVGDILLLDVTPLSLGILTEGDMMTKLIDANTTIPTTKSEIFTTAADMQTSVEIVVLQGERPMAKDNKLLGRFHLDGIMPAPRGVPQIEVKFDIDANGILMVSAVDKATGKQQNIRIEGSSGLSEDEINRMKAEAEANAEADKKEAERVNVLNNADSMIFRANNFIKESGDKISEEKKAEIEHSVDALKNAYEEKDVDSCKACMELLSKALMEAGNELYTKSGADTGQNPFSQFFGNKQ